MSIFNPALGWEAGTGAIVGGTGAGTTKGCVVTRGGAGLYTLTLDRALNVNDGGLLLTVIGAAAAYVTYLNTSDTVKAITSFNQAGAAADQSWNGLAYRVNG